MLTFIINNFYRILSKKNYIIVALIMTLGATTFAVVLTEKSEVKGKIALVSSSENNSLNSEYIKVTVMDKEPPKSDLILGKYDGVIIDNGKGSYKINTIKSDNFKNTLEEVIKNPNGYKPEIKNTRGIGVNILGFLEMFILIQCVAYMFILAEDREQMQIKRIASSPVSLYKYMLSHFISIYLLVFTPAFFILGIMKTIFNINIGFTLMEYGGLLTLLISLGITFAMLINSILKGGDNANMIGSAVITLTTVLSGSFYSFEGGNKILENLLRILPQKNFLDFVQGLENNSKMSEILPQLSYILVLIVLFYIISCVKIKKDYINCSR